MRCALSFLQAVHNTEYFLRRGGLLCLSYKEHARVTVGRCTSPVTDKPKFLFSQQFFSEAFFLRKSSETIAPPLFQIQAPHCLSWLVGETTNCPVLIRGAVIRLWKMTDKREHLAAITSLEHDKCVEERCRAGRNWTRAFLWIPTQKNIFWVYPLIWLFQWFRFARQVSNPLLWTDNGH